MASAPDKVATVAIKVQAAIANIFEAVHRLDENIPLEILTAQTYGLSTKNAEDNNID